MNIDEIEEAILRKYKDGRDLDEGDRVYVEYFCSIGMMKKGISLRRRAVTAKTIGLGLRLIGES